MSGPRLLLFFPSTDRGGCEEYCLRVAREAAMRGYQVSACFPDLPRTRGLRAELQESGVATGPWSSSGVEAETHQARALLRTVRPDRVWLALPWVDLGLGFLEAVGAGGPGGLCVWQLADGVVEVPPDAAARARRSLDAGLRWVGVSQGVRRSVARSYQVDPDRIAVIPNGLLWPEVPTLEAGAAARLRREVRQELGLPPDAEVALTVARLCIEQKAQDVLVAALAQLRARPRLHAVWVGEGDDRPALTALIAAAGLGDRITLLGFRRDVPRLLAAADLFVLPSNLEGLPFSLLEAMAIGCPVVATAIDGVRELVSHEGEGLLVPPREPAALAGALGRLLDDCGLRADLTGRARALASRQGAAGMLARSFDLLEGAV